MRLSVRLPFWIEPLIWMGPEPETALKVFRMADWVSATGPVNWMEPELVARLSDPARLIWCGAVTVIPPLPVSTEEDTVA